MTRKDLPDILYQLIKELGGSAAMMTIFRKFWKEHKNEIQEGDDFFYTWNYDIRWAATKLRKEGRMKEASRQENTHGANISSRGIWEII
ncbi:MAG: hypothetical protein K2M89_01740 [Clostridiales bacterium]|nr:hypothetical protein [Clostridiales bacterium]